MTIVDLIIKNGKIFTPFGLIQAGIAIEGQKILTIAKDAILPDADKYIDADGNLVIPGGIDAHTHVHQVYGETFKNATEAAIAGGTTMFMEFAGSGWGEPTDKSMREGVETMKEIAEKESSIDFNIHAMVCPTIPPNMAELDEINGMTKDGIASFKHFTANPNGTFSGLNSGLIVESFKRIKEANGIASTHAENEELRVYLVEKLKKAGRSDPMAHPESRPRLCEDEAVLRMILFAREIGTPLHVFHVASGNAAGFVGQAKQDNLSITGETCPHYLFFTQEDLKKFGPYLQVNPCIKSKSDREALWQTLANGSMDIVVTDHYAPPKDHKEKGWENCWEVEGGVPGLQTRMMLMMSEGVNKDRISLERFVDACCTRPAKIFGLFPKKGVIQVGSDADIVIIDPKKEIEIRADKLHHKCDWTPYEGWIVRGVPIATMVKGKLMMEDEEVWGEPGWGKFVPRRIPKM